MVIRGLHTANLFLWQLALLKVFPVGAIFHAYAWFLTGTLGQNQMMDI